MFGLGMGELLIIFLVVLVLFGSKKLPQLGAGLAAGIRNFQKGIKGENTDDQDPQGPKNPQA
jgi:sec-independent protein translocase protein TatA